MDSRDKKIVVNFRDRGCRIKGKKKKEQKENLKFWFDERITKEPTKVFSGDAVCNFKFLKRYFAKNVHRPFDDVLSELLQKFKNKKDRLFLSKFLSSAIDDLVEDGDKVLNKSGEVNSCDLYHNCLYVNQFGFLKITNGFKKSKSLKKDKNLFKINDFCYLKRIRSVWYKIIYKKSNKVMSALQNYWYAYYDKIKEDPVLEVDCYPLVDYIKFFGYLAEFVSKSQITNEEFKKLTIKKKRKNKEVSIRGRKF
jgi:hypothetical protein